MNPVRMPVLLSTLCAALAGCGDGQSPDVESTPDEVSNPQALVGVCDGVTCSGHGVCRDNAGSAVCTCDEGFTGPSCGTRGGDYGARTLLMQWLADPDVYKEHDDLFFLTGTGNGVLLPLYESNDLRTFQFKRDYNPSAADPVYDYCFLWAPDLGKYNGAYQLYFSAHRVFNGAACPPAGQEVTTFVARAPDLNFNSGPLRHRGHQRAVLQHPGVPQLLGREWRLVPGPLRRNGLRRPEHALAHCHSLSGAERPRRHLHRVAGLDVSRSDGAGVEGTFSVAAYSTAA